VYDSKMPYWVCYLSSHTGCAHSCRFCHLTATGQTTMRPATLNEYLDQAKVVLDGIKNADQASTLLIPPSRIHFNFMARGEALSNPSLLNNPRPIFDGLNDMAEEMGLEPRFLISTIMPR